MNKIYVWFLLLAVVFSGSCKGNKNKGKKGKKKKFIPLVGVIESKIDNFTPEINSVGYARPLREVVLSVERPGKLLKLVGEVGDYLQKNSHVARVRSLGLWSQRSGAKARISEIKASLGQTKRDFSKIKKLRTKGVVTQNEVEMAELQLKTRKTQLRSANASLSQVNENLYGTSVFAKFSGEVAAKYQSEGNFVNMGTPLIKLVDLSKIKITVGVSELTVTKLKVSEKVEVRSVAWPGRIWEGVIISIAPANDPSSGSFPVEIEIPNSPDLRSKPINIINGSSKGHKHGKKPEKKWLGPWIIKAGMTMKVRFFKPRISGIFLPVEAILDRDGKKWIYVVKNPVFNKKTLSKVEFRQVKTGVGFEGWKLISHGIKNGESVVVAGSGRLRKDSTVRVRKDTRAITSEVGHFKKKSIKMRNKNHMVVSDLESKKVVNKKKKMIISTPKSSTSKTKKIETKAVK
jgi:membrane fusion protein, multidrug efflux system